jgi:hypothetical protein
MLKLFSTGIIANLVFVASGALKQYFIAAQLVVTDVGVYGAWVAQASLLIVLVPLPAYLDLLIRGFSAAPEDHPMRGSLVSAVLREFRWITSIAAVLLALVLLAAFASHTRLPNVEGLLLLVVAQYLAQIADIALRMYQAHQRYALFLGSRNLPTLALIIALGLDQPIAIACAETLSAFIVGAMAFRAYQIRDRDRTLPLARVRAAVRGEHATLWLARLVQYSNASLLRLVVPFVFAAHEAGLFFFACIAQIPASLFLSVTTQLFGHVLARMKAGAWREIWRVQFWFLIPNLLYVTAVAMLVPYWAWLMTHVPGLSPYAGIGLLVFAVALYSSVLASDCTEYLLRSRGLSRVLLFYNLSSICAQITCLLVSTMLGVSLEHTIVLCAVMAGIVLAGFSNYSFRRVIGGPTVVAAG